MGSYTALVKRRLLVFFLLLGDVEVKLKSMNHPLPQ
jgi:hypothetical protein